MVNGVMVNGVWGMVHREWGIENTEWKMGKGNCEN